MFLKLNKQWSRQLQREEEDKDQTIQDAAQAGFRDVLLYGCETWKMNQGDEKKISVFRTDALEG